MPTPAAADAAEWCGIVGYGPHGTPKPPTAPTWTAHWNPCTTGWQRYPKRHCSARPWRVVGGAGRAGRAHTLMRGLRPAIAGARGPPAPSTCRPGPPAFVSDRAFVSDTLTPGSVPPSSSGHGLCEGFPILCFFHISLLCDALLCLSHRREPDSRASISSPHRRPLHLTLKPLANVAFTPGSLAFTGVGVQTRLT